MPRPPLTTRPAPPRSGHRARGRSVLARLRGTDDVGAEFDDICTAADESNRVSTLASYRALFSAGCRPMLIVTTLIAMLQQLTGINAIMFYVSREGPAVLLLALARALRMPQFKARLLRLLRQPECMAPATALPRRRADPAPPLRPPSTLQVPVLFSSFGTAREAALLNTGEAAATHLLAAAGWRAVLPAWAQQPRARAWQPILASARPAVTPNLNPRPPAASHHRRRERGLHLCVHLHRGPLRPQDALPGGWHPDVHRPGGCGWLWSRQAW